jgi:hypothetical protein
MRAAIDETKETLAVSVTAASWGRRRLTVYFEERREIAYFDNAKRDQTCVEFGPVDCRVIRPSIPLCESSSGQLSAPFRTALSRGMSGALDVFH